jgi:D-alanine-D-alanine ligase
MTTPAQAEDIRRLLSETTQDIVLFTDLLEFVRQAPTLRDYIVWPHWNGSRSRNRTAHVASVCEIHGLRYIGPDAYARLIANDKSLSKIFVRQAGLDTPESVFVAIPDDAQLIEALRPPVIVKPNIEGSSIGIDDASVVDNTSEAKELAVSRLNQFPDGVIVEEFVHGPEVFIGLAFDSHGGHRWGCSERIVDNDAEYLRRHVYDYNLKFTDRRQVSLRPFQLSENLLPRILRLAETIKTLDLLRIDGRVRDGRFFVIEITPDPLMTSESEFLGSLAQAGHQPIDVLADLIERAAARHSDLPSSSSGTSG